MTKYVLERVLAKTKMFSVSRISCSLFYSIFFSLFSFPFIFDMRNTSIDPNEVVAKRSFIFIDLCYCCVCVCTCLTFAIINKTKIYNSILLSIREALLLIINFYDTTASFVFIKQFYTRKLNESNNFSCLSTQNMLST